MNWAFLVLEDHPYGREMLDQLLRAGFEPGLVVEERSAVATEERGKFLERMAGFRIAPRLDALLDGRAAQRRFVGNHNDDACHAALSQLAPDLIVLGGTRILKPRIFATARDGALNSHPGLLPEVRGSASVAWAIALDQRIGSTCHFIEAGIDTGPIVGRRELAVHRGDSYEKLCHATTVLSATLMVEALAGYVAGTLHRTPQPPGDPAHRNIPAEQLAEVKTKLADGRYRHYAD